MTITSLAPTTTTPRAAAVVVYPGELGSGDRILVGDATMVVESVLRDTGARSGHDFLIVTARATGRRPVELLCGEHDSMLRLELV